jgi:hypothetical protein
MPVSGGKLPGKRFGKGNEIIGAPGVKRSAQENLPHREKLRFKERVWFNKYEG